MAKKGTSKPMSSKQMYTSAKKMSPITTKNATPKNQKVLQPPKNNKKGK